MLSVFKAEISHIKKKVNGVSVVCRTLSKILRWNSPQIVLTMPLEVEFDQWSEYSELDAHLRQKIHHCNNFHGLKFIICTSRKKSFLIISLLYF